MRLLFDDVLKTNVCLRSEGFEKKILNTISIVYFLYARMFTENFNGRLRVLSIRVYFSRSALRADIVSLREHHRVL